METNSEIEQFLQRSLTEQKKIVFTTGAFIAWREHFDQRLALYCLGNFFVQVWYQPRMNNVHRIDAFPGDDERIDLFIDFENSLDQHQGNRDET